MSTPDSERTEITVLDKLTYAGNRANLPAEHPRLTFVHGDICDRQLLLDLLPGHEAVVHFAAESHVDRSLVRAADFVGTNCVGTHNVMEASLAAGVSPPGARVHRRGVRLHHGRPLDGGVAARAELALRGVEGGRRPDHPLLRPHPRPRRVHHPLHQQLRPVPARRETHPPCSPPTCWAASPFRSTATAPTSASGCTSPTTAVPCSWCRRAAAPARSSNVGGGTERTNREITDLLLDLCEADPSLVDRAPDRKGHDLRYALDDSKIRTELGYAPEVPFEEGLASTVAWYADNPSWWQPLKKTGRQVSPADGNGRGAHPVGSAAGRTS